MKFNVDALKKLDLGERLVRRNPLFYPAARQQLDALDAADLKQRRAWSEERLRCVLQVARDTTYGRSVGGRDSYQSWPLLEKSTARERHKDLLARRSWFSATAATGGTTGIPLKLVRSPQSVAVEQACIDRLFERLGADPRTARIAVLRGDNIPVDEDPQRPYWRHAMNGRRLILSSNSLSAQTLNHYVREIEQFAPDVLYAYPTSLEQLCRLLEQSARRLPIARVVTSSEVLRPEAWYLAKRVLGCRMVDYYGQAERVGFAEASESGAYRFVPGYAYIELLPQQSKDGFRLYEIVGTSLWNLTLPLVRYRTGDQIRLPESFTTYQLEEIVLGLRSFSGVLGREHEVLLGPEGVRLTGINQVPRNVEHVLRIQVIQETFDDVRVLVIPDTGYSTDDADHLMRNVRLKVPESMAVTIETTDCLEKTPLGKTPFVIHRPAIAAALQTLQASA